MTQVLVVTKYGEHGMHSASKTMFKKIFFSCKIFVLSFLGPQERYTFVSVATLHIKQVSEQGILLDKYITYFDLMQMYF